MSAWVRTMIGLVPGHRHDSLKYSPTVYVHGCISVQFGGNPESLLFSLFCILLEMEGSRLLPEKREVVPLCLGTAWDLSRG